jgi:UDPglucose 6-dehydrogenase
MKICVFGLWHLGSVTAACMAERFPTIGLDPDSEIVNALEAGRPPILEPGLEELVRAGQSGGRLRFTNDASYAVAEADIVWVAFDTPVDEEDRADVAFVESQIASLFPYLREGSIILISSQWPVGSTNRVESSFRREHPGRDVQFAYSPENLRLGKAIDAFRNPKRIVIGARGTEVRDRLERLLLPFCDNLVWMSIESAEMTKHALNAFLANSIVFINEIATLCEEVGADAKEVENGLKSEERIGPRAYLGAGGPFAGGTLARDVGFLIRSAEKMNLPAPLLKSIRCSNDLHKEWPRFKLKSVCGSLSGKTVTVLGLTYKPGTDTLRRSVSVELCNWLATQDVNVKAFDPVIRRFPEQLSPRVILCDSVIDALRASHAVVISTEWPQFKELTSRDLTENMETPVVLDANRFLERSLNNAPPLTYVAVGMPKGRV